MVEGLAEAIKKYDLFVAFIYHDYIWVIIIHYHPIQAPAQSEDRLRIIRIRCFSNFRSCLRQGVFWTIGILVWVRLFTFKFRSRIQLAEAIHTFL